MKNCINRIILVSAMAVLVSGCAGLKPVKRIQPGDFVYLHYTCSAKNRGIIETTDKNVAQDPDLKKSRVFLKNRGKGTRKRLIAGQNQPGTVPGKLNYLSVEIQNRLAQELVGKAYGETHQVVINSELVEGLQFSARYRRINRSYTRPRIQEKGRKSLARKLSRENDFQVGEIIEKKGLPYMEVIGLSPDKVTVKFLVDNGLEIDRFPGTSRLSAGKTEAEMVVTLDSKVGNLVRTGPLIGRVAEITKESILIDYGHPFGYEELECRVEVSPAVQDK